MIQIRDLTFCYKDKAPIFQDFCWSSREGERWAIIGPSGCGKSTLLYLLAGLRHPTSGSICVHGEPVQKPRQDVGLILQDYGLLPWESAQANVALGLKLRGINGSRRKELVDRWMATLGIREVAGHYPVELSGGQRQRVAIARTMVLDPKLLLMDEPFASLDAITREGLQELVLTLGSGSDLSSVIVTHSIEEAVLLGGKVLVLGRPPNQRALIIDNPDSGCAEYRHQMSFFSKCQEVRQIIDTMTRESEGRGAQ